MTPMISAITTCKGRLEHLKLTLPHLMALEGCEVIVVDYDCPDGAADWVRATYPAATVVPGKNQPFFNLSHARNLGAAAASAPWLFLVDADVIISRDLIGAVTGLLQPDVYLLPDPRPFQLWGTLLVARTDFDAIGGYDEAFQGYGWEDVDIIERLRRAGLNVKTFPGGLLTSLPHDNKSRARFHEISNLGVNWTINAFYSAAKIDLMGQGVYLSPEQARNLYAGVRAAVQSPGDSPNLKVPLPKRKIADRVLEVSLTYRLLGPGSAAKL